MAAATTRRSSSSTVRSEAGTALEHVIPTEEAVGAESGALQTISQMIYTGSYALAYGVVYAAVFVTKLLPQENPVMRGFHDGGRAAVDELSRN
jgi:hypothetical protein